MGLLQKLFLQSTESQEQPPKKTTTPPSTLSSPQPKTLNGIKQKDSSVASFLFCCPPFSPLLCQVWGEVYSSSFTKALSIAHRVVPSNPNIPRPRCSHHPRLRPHSHHPIQFKRNIYASQHHCPPTTATKPIHIRHILCSLVQFTVMIVPMWQRKQTI